MGPSIRRRILDSTIKFALQAAQMKVPGPMTLVKTLWQYNPEGKILVAIDHVCPEKINYFFQGIGFSVAVSNMLEIFILPNLLNSPFAMIGRDPMGELMEECQPVGLSTDAFAPLMLPSEPDTSHCSGCLHLN